MRAQKEIIYSSSVHLKWLHFKQHNLDRNREVLSSGSVPLGLILLLAESGTLSLAMSMETKWSDEVLEFWAVGHELLPFGNGRATSVYSTRFISSVFF